HPSHHSQLTSFNTHTHIQIHHKERRELVAKEEELGAALGTTLLPTSSSLLFIL
ncbi:unnamed protein product, partial [Prunus brigantina]